MLNLRRDDGAKYNPRRDILQLFTELAMNASLAMAKSGWDPDLRAWAAYSGLKPDDLSRAMIALARFQHMATSGPSNDPTDAWARAGFDALPAPARIGTFYCLGLAVLSAFHHFARESLERKAAPVGADETSEGVEIQAAGLSTKAFFGFGGGKADE